MSGVRACQGDDEVSRGRWPAGLVGMLALMMAVEAGFLRAGRDLEALSAADWGRARRVAAGATVARAEILCVGDSLVKTGIIPTAIEARLDRPAYNLAGLGAPPPAAYALLKRAIEAGGAAEGDRPRREGEPALAPRIPRRRGRLGHSARPVGGPPARVDRRRPRPLRSLSRPSRSLHQAPCRRPQDAGRTDYRSRSAGPWRPAIERQYRANRGAVLFADRPGAAPDPAPDGVLSSGESAVCYPESWSPWPTNVAYLDRTLALAASRGIPVFFVIPPIHPGVQTLRESLGRDAEYVSLVERLVARHPNAIVVDGRHAGFAPRSCFDGRHLNVDGATALSESLADVIAARLDRPAPGSRWVKLPPYKRPTARMAVEDLDESRSLVARRTARQ